MPDQLTGAHVGSWTPHEEVAATRRSLRPSLLQGLAVVVGFAVVGAGLGLLWEHLWHPTIGTVVRHQWFVVDDQLRYDLDGLRNQFSATGLFVVISLVAGAVLGVLSALLLARDELVTLVAVTLGAVLGAVVMWQVGVHLGPADPDVLARTAKKGTELPEDLSLGSLGALLCLPFAAVLGLCATFFLVPRRRPRRDVRN